MMEKIERLFYVVLLLWMKYQLDGKWRVEVGFLRFLAHLWNFVDLWFVLFDESSPLKCHEKFNFFGPPLPNINRIKAKIFRKKSKFSSNCSESPKPHVTDTITHQIIPITLTQHPIQFVSALLSSISIQKISLQNCKIKALLISVSIVWMI